MPPFGSYDAGGSFTAQFVRQEPLSVQAELTAALPDGYAAAAHAVIVLLPQDSQPYRVLVWDPLPSSLSR